MIAQLKQNWWILTLRGALAVLFGILAFAWPVATAFAFVFILAAFAFIEGIFALIGAFGWGLPATQRFLLILMGLLGLAVGVCAVLYPGILAVTLVFVVAWWPLISHFIPLASPVALRK